MSRARARLESTMTMETKPTTVADGVSDPRELLIASDPAMERIVRAAGPVTFRPPAADYFNALARPIVCQLRAGLSPPRRVVCWACAAPPARSVSPRLGIAGGRPTGCCRSDALLKGIGGCSATADPFQ